jgi:ACS family glucarate transporter-like MFS transporter
MMDFIRRYPVRLILVFGLFILSAIAFMDRTNVSIAGVAIGREYQLDKIRLGWIFSAFLVGYALFQVPGGWLASRMGPRRVLALAVLWWGLFTALTAAVPSHAPGALLMLVLVRLALGVGESVIYPAANQFVARWIPTPERGTAHGWIFAGVGAGSGLTPPLLTFIASSHGWRASFFFCAIVGLVAGAVWYFVARDRPHEHPWVGPAELAHIEAGVAAAPANAPAPVPWARIFSSRQVWALTFSYFTFGYVIWIFFSWFFIYLADARGLTLTNSALYSMLPFTAMTVCCLTGGVLNDAIARRHGLRAGRCGLAIVSLLMTAAFLACGSRVASPMLASIVLAGGAGAIYLSQSSFWAVVADSAGAHTGVVSGVMNMGCQIGGALTASLTPWIAAHFGWNSAFGAAAVLAVAGAAGWAFVHPQQLLRTETAVGGGIIASGSYRI